MLSPKVIVIGIDGGYWDIIKSNLHRLSTFRKILENGAWGGLKSTIPPVTCPAWKSYATGKSPESLGIFWWAHVDFKNSKLRFFNSLDFQEKEIWDFLSENGYRSIVINLPLTYPPKKISGIMISGFPASDGDNYTYPRRIKEELVRKFDYRVNPRMHIEINPTIASEEIYNIIQKRFDVLFHYLETGNFDFVHLTVFYTDDLQHFMWNDKEVILKAYEIIDKNLGKIIKQYPDSNIIIFSDHGFEGIIDSFYINSYFLQKGYLKLKKNMVGSTFSKLVSKLMSIPGASQLLSRIFTSLPRKYQLRIKKQLGALGEEHSLEKIVNIKESLVVGLKQGVVFVNKEKVKEKGMNPDKFIEQLIEELNSITHPQTGEKLVTDIYLPKNKSLNGPDIIIHTKNFEIELKIVPGHLWKSETGDMGGWIARHNPVGIFMAYGPHILNGGEIQGARIIDIAPTILKLYGITPPLDGRILKEIIKDESPVRNKDETAIRDVVRKLKDKL